MIRRKITDKYPHVIDWIHKSGMIVVAEYKFHDTRRWRFDFAMPDIKLAIEVDGGVWSGGRHSGGKGQIADMEKGNAAVCLGWRVLHYTPQQIKKQDWLKDVQKTMDIINAA